VLFGIGEVLFGIGGPSLGGAAAFECGEHRRFLGAVAGENEG
jgi:hypothetical protein